MGKGSTKCSWWRFTRQDGYYHYSGMDGKITSSSLIQFDVLNLYWNRHKIRLPWLSSPFDSYSIQISHSPNECIRHTNDKIGKGLTINMELYLSATDATRFILFAELLAFYASPERHVKYHRYILKFLWIANFGYFAHLISFHYLICCKYDGIDILRIERGLCN